VPRNEIAGVFCNHSQNDPVFSIQLLRKTH